MEKWIRGLAWAGLILLAASGCGRDERSSAERAAEAQKAIQQGAEREKKMFEGMQKGVEGLEKSLPEQKEKGKQ